LPGGLASRSRRPARFAPGLWALAPAASEAAPASDAAGAGHLARSAVEYQAELRIESGRPALSGSVRKEWWKEQCPFASGDRGKVEVAFGDTGLEILSAVERYKADLLIIGRHGARHASGGFLGSVAEFLLRNGSGPVLVVAKPPAAAD
jgi:nucleotide-binding universal stress UspA family protein